MELNREQIIKALEWCIQNESCEYCEYREHTDPLEACPLKSDSLTLIKELTVELEAMRTAGNSLKSHNKKLTEQNEKLKKAKYVFSTVDYCADDLATALKEIEKLEAETKRLESLCVSKDIVIGDLTEENERLRASSVDYRNIPDIIAEARADTVRKMQERLKKKGYISTPTESYVSFSDIDQTAKEIAND